MLTLVLIFIAFIAGNTYNKEQSSTPEAPAQVAGATQEKNYHEVTSITDGDTLKIRIDGKIETVRVANINTPETVDPRKSVECMGKEASAMMAQLTTGKKVSLEADTTQTSTDRYGRLIRFIFLEDGTDVGLELVRLGLAHSSPYGDTPHKYLSEYAAAQAKAQLEKLGLWNPTACNTPIPATPKPTPALTPPTEKAIAPTSQPVKTIETTENYVCDCSKTCSQISSCAEALYQLTTCGCKQRDGDGDGIACDSQCQ